MVLLPAVELGTYTVPWAEAGTAFGNAVASAINAKGFRYQWGRLPNGWFHCAPEDGGSLGTLICMPVSTGIRCLIVGASGFAPEKAEPIWRDAVAAAVDAVRERRLWYWSAMIGPSPRSAGSNYVLAKGARLGPAQLKAADTYMREWTHNQAMNDMLSWSAWGSWPVIVSGSGQAFDSEDSRELAVYQLNRICGLIGQAWNCWWTVRTGPWPWNAPVDMAVPPYAYAQEAQLFTDDAEPRRKLRELPAWLEVAWSNLGRYPHLEVALNSFNEGIRLALHHPSYAVVAFVATIENVGAGPAIGPSGKIKE